MNPSDIIKKPIVTEKVNKQTEKQNRYCFVVDKRANKLEIKKAVESFYNVRVDNVNTCVVPAKAKSRMTKAGVLNGRKPSYK
jgi:large subunit ribosomal protein L23